MFWVFYKVTTNKYGGLGIADWGNNKNGLAFKGAFWDKHL